MLVWDNLDDIFSLILCDRDVHGPVLRGRHGPVVVYDLAEQHVERFVPRLGILGINENISADIDAVRRAGRVAQIVRPDEASFEAGGIVLTGHFDVIGEVEYHSDIIFRFFHFDGGARPHDGGLVAPGLVENDRARLEDVGLLGELHIGAMVDNG